MISTLYDPKVRSVLDGMHAAADSNDPPLLAKARGKQGTARTALLDDAFSGKSLPEPVCPNDQVEKNIALARELGFNGTPTLVRDDGTVLSGYRPAEQLSEWIDEK